MKFEKKITFIALAILIAGSLAFAQTKVSVTIQCNVSGAQVYLNDNLAGYTSPNFNLLVFPSTYTIRVVKDGFAEFRTTVTAMHGPVVIVANLMGMSPQMPPSSSPSLPPAGPQQLPPPNLVQPASRAQLSIDSNVDSASVFINNAYVGNTPYQSILPRGTYLIRLTAPGYDDHTESVSIDSYTRLHISLTPLSVEYEIKLPKNLLNSWGHFDTLGDVRLFIDDQRLDRLQGHILPGRHTFTMIYKNLRLEDDFIVTPGKPVTLELSLGVRVY